MQNTCKNNNQKTTILVVFFFYQRALVKLRLLFFLEKLYDIGDDKSRPEVVLNKISNRISKNKTLYKKTFFKGEKHHDY